MLVSGPGPGQNQLLHALIARKPAPSQSSLGASARSHLARPRPRSHLAPALALTSARPLSLGNYISFATNLCARVLSFATIVRNKRVQHEGDGSSSASNAANWTWMEG